MSPPKPPVQLPPACADCQTITQKPGGAASPPSPSRMLRASDGKMRVDSGNVSVITDPKAQHAIVLDHAAKEARFLPMAPSQPGAPKSGLPPLGAMPPSFQAPTAAAMQGQDLGRMLIHGQEAEGKRYMIQPPAPPQPPKVPGLGLPQAPGMPSPQKPQPPAAPTVAEVWTGTKLGLPVLTKVTGPFGQLTCGCKAAPVEEPHPAMFQVPAGYKQIIPPGVSAPKPK